jgi:hypothetical protein
LIRFSKLTPVNFREVSDFLLIVRLESGSMEV